MSVFAIAVLIVRPDNLFTPRYSTEETRDVIGWGQRDPRSDLCCTSTCISREIPRAWVNEERDRGVTDDTGRQASDLKA